jgi:hypothetical protein
MRSLPAQCTLSMYSLRRRRKSLPIKKGLVKKRKLIRPTRRRNLKIKRSITLQRHNLI